MEPQYRMLSIREILVRLTVAALLGAVIGVEREVRRRPAGIRTSMAVCLGSALFTVLSAEVAHRFGDTSGTRIASNIVQGIGFLGAGAILREAGSLTGLTTAATIFVEAAIGMAVGGGLYGVAAYATGMVLFGLIVLGWFEEWASLKRRAVHFRVTAASAHNVAGEVQTLLAGLKVPIRHLRVSMVGDTSVVEFEADVGHGQEKQIVQALNRAGITTEVILVEGRHE